jgi:hypothetical protein
MNKIFIIMWWYSDKSGFGIVRAYDDEKTANGDLDMLRLHSGVKEFALETIDIVD